MRKTVLGFIASFMLLSAHAQDLKIKKGEVLLGGTPVALVKRSEKESATFLRQMGKGVHILHYEQDKTRHHHTRRLAPVHIT